MVKAVVRGYCPELVSCFCDTSHCHELIKSSIICLKFELNCFHDSLTKDHWEMKAVL